MVGWGELSLCRKQKVEKWASHMEARAGGSHVKPQD
jgi:hypothetical protein